LPGFSFSKLFLRKGVADLGGYLFDVDTILSTGGNEEALLHAANVLIAFRNQIELSARKTMGGGGKNEGGLAGALQDWERKFFLIGSNEEKLNLYKNECFDSRKDIIVNLILAFDHGRVEDLSNKKDIWKQHAMTITDAYPQLCEAAKITSEEIIKLQGTGSKLWHEKYGKL